MYTDWVYITSICWIIQVTVTVNCNQLSDQAIVDSANDSMVKYDERCVFFNTAGMDYLCHQSLLLFLNGLENRLARTIHV